MNTLDRIRILGLTSGWHVFDPRDGFPVRITRTRFGAWLACKRRYGTDYGRPLAGW